MSRFLHFSPAEAAEIRQQLEQRFSERTAQGCWVKPGNVSNGYPEFRWKGRSYRAHRVSFAVWKNGTPKKWLVCHLCSNKQCVNPAHLVLGLHSHNHDDHIRKTKNPKFPEQPIDPEGLSWPPGLSSKWLSPLEAMAFPASAHKPPPYIRPTRALEKMAFPASYREEEE